MKVILALNGISPCGDVVKAATARPWPSGSFFCLLNVLDHILSFGLRCCWIVPKAAFAKT